MVLYLEGRFRTMMSYRLVLEHPLIKLPSHGIVAIKNKEGSVKDSGFAISLFVPFASNLATSLTI